ncbi:hypothetical protein HUS82_16130, partial [Pseudomonas protegens]|nr:hypothetical protein [Pseudomonas protegens]
ASPSRDTPALTSNRCLKVAAPGPARDALRAELLTTFKHLLLVSAGVSLLGLAAAIAMPNRLLRGREDKAR